MTKVKFSCVALSTFYQTLLPEFKLLVVRKHFIQIRLLNELSSSCPVSNQASYLPNWQAWLAGYSGWLVLACYPLACIAARQQNSALCHRHRRLTEINLALPRSG